MGGLVGLIPAAGKATRMHGLPKYLLPINNSYLLMILCERMRIAGCEQIMIGANPDNHLLIEQYAPSDAVVYTVNSETMSATLLAARRWCGDATVIFAMPDAWWSQDNIFKGMVAIMKRYNQVCSVAHWKAREDQRKNLGMVKTDVRRSASLDSDHSVVVDVVDKPTSTTLTHAWGAIAWSPKFWECLHPDDPHVGIALIRAIAKQWEVGAVTQAGNYWDCGIPSEYFKLIKGVW